MDYEIFNEKRKIILQRIDDGEVVSNMELGMYDLSPYFSMNSFDANLSEMILMNKNEKRKIMHIENEYLYFSKPQHEALMFLEQNNRVLLSAPTSFGKTILVKEYIHKRHPKSIAYIVPTNALAYELEKSFKSNSIFNEYYDIFDKSILEKEDMYRINRGKKPFFIGTQEKYLELPDEIFPSIELFVIDEAYKLKESTKKQRSYILSKAFLNGAIKKSEKIFLLTPQIIFNGFEDFDFHEFSTSYNAVEKNYVVLNIDEFYTELIHKGNEDKTILFCSSPRQISEVYGKISMMMDEEYNELIGNLESDIHPDWSVVKLLRKGILSHHGQMPKYVQNKMIDLFNTDDNYKILFGTQSISEGINTSTKNLFIYPDIEKKNTVEKLLLKNTIGRAGRLGKYPMGYIFSVSNIENYVNSELEITLAISEDESILEIEDSSNEILIESCSLDYELDPEFCKAILNEYNISLTKFKLILNELIKDQKFPDIRNLPFIAKNVYQKDYISVPGHDAILIRGYLQDKYKIKDKFIKILDFNDRINFFRQKYSGEQQFDNTEIINMYMQFIYSTLEYHIMPIVKIGLEIKEKFPNWKFGKNVYESLENCRTKYNKKLYGELPFDSLSNSHKQIISSMKDYGMTATLKYLNVEMLNEMESIIGVRYSTSDVIKAIKTLAVISKDNKEFYLNVIRKYLL